MADGQILIDARIQTDEAKKDTQDLKKQLESLADSASASAKNIEKSFDSLSIEDAAEGLGESFEREAQEVKDIPDQIEKEFDDIDLEDVADGLADGFGEEADKTKEHSKETEKAIEALTDKIKRQNNELDDLKTAYVNARHQYGETSDEAEKLAREIQDLSGELAQSKREFKEAAKAADSFDRSLDDIDVPDDLNAFFSGFLGGVGAGLTNAAIDLVEEAGRALVEFGKNSISLASDLQEVQNVVDTAFPHMSRQVEEFAQSAISSAGLSETAAKKYLGTYGTMAKSFGFTEEAAFNLSTTMVQLAGDVASFYNISADEAYTKLMAVFTGETEALKELGVIMTETELDAYAMAKGIDKGTQGMGRQEKAALRLEYAMEALSAAQGDFAKTSESWANQTKILAENWDSFSASVGEGLINFLTPAIKSVNNDIMPALQQIGDRFSEMTIGSAIFGDWIDLFGAIGGTAEETAESVSDVATEAFNLIPVTETLSNATEETAATVGTVRQEYDAAREAARASLDTQIGLLTELSDKSSKSANEIVANWEKQKEALNRYAENMQKAVDRGLDETLVRQLSDGSQESMAILDELVKGTDEDIQAINEAFQGVEDAKGTVASTMADVQTDMSGKLAEMAGNVSEEWGTMASMVGESISEMQAYIDSLQGKDVYVNVLMRTGSLAGGIRDQITGGAVPYEAAPANIPYLASGAVIPPNAPFMAVLGDQKNGTNIEAPLDTIKQAVSEVIGSGSIEVHNYVHFDGNLAQLGRVLKPVIDAEAKRKGDSLAKGAVK